MNYDFMTLSPQDFEALIADLLSRQLKLRLELFKPGKDSGIDLRHALTSESPNALVVQCKRYSVSAFSDLRRSLKKELPNIELLKPNRYLVATTTALSPANKQVLIQTLQPWILSPGDIYGPDELNQLLRTFPEVLASHFKLWISSTTVLERVLNARIFAHTEATLEATRRYASKLVVHEGLNQALDHLRKRHHVMVVGNPGIGKTTLARMLMCYYMEEEEFEPVWVTGDLEDAWAATQSAVGSHRKFVIVYDDFLGRVRFDHDKLGKNEDASLIALLERASARSNLRLILTTREYILADAMRLHGTLASREREIVKYTLSLTVYAARDRAQMLFNHLYFSDLPRTRLQKLVQTKAYRKVLDNPKFNPRIVETVSNHANSQAMTDDDYLAYFTQEFDNPASLWKHPFETEISPVARQVLAIIWTMRGQAEHEVLEKSVRKLNTQGSGVEFHIRFKEALRQLEGNFLVTGRHLDRLRTQHFFVAEFQNPSVEEYIESVVTTEVWFRELIGSCVTIDQVQVLASGLERAKPSYSKSLWSSLRTAAHECKAVQSGRLINYQSWNEAKASKTWETESVDAPTIILDLLQIEKKAGVSDLHADQLFSHVLTPAGWTDLLESVPFDATLPYAISRLQRWIVEESGWDLAQIDVAESSLRASVIQLFSKDNAYPIDIDSVRVLVESSLLVNQSLAAHEVNIIAETVRGAAQTSLSNHRDAVTLRDEAEAAEDLGRILDINFRELARDLREAAHARERLEEDTRDNAATERRRFAERMVDLDVDTLFSDLLDR